MFLQLGQNTVIEQENIIGIFDLDKCTISKKTRDYLSKAEKSGKIIYASYELPKSFILCCEENGYVVYISQLSSSTINKRIENMSFNILKE